MNHPYSPLHDSQRENFPSVPTIEERGRTWREREGVSDDYLVGFVMESWGTDAANQTPAVMEMQRRLLVAIRAFNSESGRQARTMIRLTWAIAALTVVIAILTAVMLWKG